MISEINNCIGIDIFFFTGLLLSSGRKWHQRRKIITPSFHFKILEHFTEVMERQGQTFVSNLKKLEGQPFDFFPQISLYALDVICGKLYVEYTLRMET